MKKGKIICRLCVLAMLFITGCGVQFPEMTKEQEAAIVEYAVRVVTNHKKDYDSRLVDLSLYAEKEEPETEEPEQGGMDETEDTPIVDNTVPNEDEKVYGVSLSELLLPEGVEITCTGFSVNSVYPDTMDDAPVFVLDASEGNSLVVIPFELCNASGETKEIDIFSHAPRCTLVINGTLRKLSLSTMLLDDFKTYIGSLAPGESVSLVVLGEIDNETAAAIESLKLIVETEKGSSEVVIQ